MLKAFAFALSLIFVFASECLSADSQPQGQQSWESIQTNTSEMQQSLEAARQNWESVRAKTGSPDTLKQHFVNPLVGGGTLKTIDESKGDLVRLTCPSSKAFLTVLIQPKGTGDFSAWIYWDTNFDNVYDGSLFVPNVSGVCTNGFISCDPGTWNNCKPYTFEAGSSVRIYGDDLPWEQVAITDLRGCFCVNNSCGSNLVWNNLGLVLKTFGGAVAGAFQKIDPRYAVSDVQIDGTAIYFYGQQEKNCTVASGGSGFPYPEQYYNSPALLSSAVANEVTAQQGDPKSYYNLMLSTQQNQLSEFKQCLVKRNIWSGIVTKYKNCAEIFGGPFVFVGGWDANGSSKQCYFDRNGSCYMLSPHDTSWDQCYSRITNTGQILAFINSSFTVGTEYTAVQVDNLQVGPMGNYSSCFGAGDDASDVHLTVYATCQSQTCEVSPSIDNSCSDFENDSSCSLWDETVDGVQTMRSGMSTGLHPLGQCYNLCGQVYCYEWVKKERTYLCSSQPIDLSGAKRRLASVVPSSQYASGTITFTDIRKDPSGNWTQYPNQQFWVGEGQQGEACEQACRVRVNMKNTQTGMTGPVSQKHTGLTPDYVYYYRPCYKGQCPVQPGEEVDIPCTCTNDFTGAVTIMQTIRMAGQDIICSSGNVKTLPGATIPTIPMDGSVNTGGTTP